MRIPGLALPAHFKGTNRKNRRSADVSTVTSTGPGALVDTGVHDFRSPLVSTTWGPGVAGWSLALARGEANRPPLPPSPPRFPEGWMYWISPPPFLGGPSNPIFCTGGRNRSRNAVEKIRKGTRASSYSIAARNPSSTACPLDRHSGMVSWSRVSSVHGPEAV